MTTTLKSPLEAQIVNEADSDRKDDALTSLPLSLSIASQLSTEDLRAINCPKSTARSFEDAWTWSRRDSERFLRGNQLVEQRMHYQAASKRQAAQQRQTEATKRRNVLYMRVLYSGRSVRMSGFRENEAPCAHL